MKTAAIIYQTIISINERFGNGFLNSLPTDIWSRIFTSWLRLAGANIGNKSLAHRKVYVKLH